MTDPGGVDTPSSVHAVRQFIAQRHVAVLLCAATLLLKLLVPAGYMIAGDQGRIVITLCSGTAPAAMVMDMAGMQGDMPDHGQSTDHARADMPCAFSGLLTPTLGAVDPVLLAALIVFILSLALTRTLPMPPAIPRHLRPPLRGPPA